MTIGTRKLFSMVAQVGRGVRKSDSHLVTDQESSQAWDQIASEVSEIKASGKGIDIPHDPEL